MVEDLMDDLRQDRVGEVRGVELYTSKLRKSKGWLPEGGVSERDYVQCGQIRYPGSDQQQTARGLFES